MNSGLKLFRMFLCLVIFLSTVLPFLNYYLLTFYVAKWKSDIGILLFIFSHFIFLTTSLAALLLIKKYPAQYISNKFEAFIYSTSILTFIASLFSWFYISIFISLAWDWREKGPNPLKTIFLFVSVTAAIASICNTFIGIYSFRLLKKIKQNWTNLAKGIKNIGVRPE